MIMTQFPGLTCYLNACLQALLNCPSFNAKLLECAPILEHSPTNDIGKLFDVFVRIAQYKKSGRQDSVREQLYEFRNCLKKSLPQIAVGLMQDAHEFLVFFCDYLGSDIAKLLASKEESLENSPIAQNFHFQLEEKRICCRYIICPKRVLMMLHYILNFLVLQVQAHHENDQR